MSSTLGIVECVTQTSAWIRGQARVPPKGRQGTEFRDLNGISRRQSRDIPSKKTGYPAGIPRDPHGIERDLGV